MPFAGDDLKCFCFLDIGGFLGLFRITGVCAIYKKLSRLFKTLACLGKRNIGVGAKRKFFSFPSKRYLRFQSFPLEGVTSRKRPLPSNNFRGFWGGLTARTLVSVSGVIRLGMGLLHAFGAFCFRKSPQTFQILLYRVGWYWTTEKEKGL